MIEITDSPDIKRWSEFVHNHPKGNIFQTPEMAEVYRRTKNYEPITLAAVDTETGDVVAVLLAVIIKERGGILKHFSTRSVIHGGPLFVEGEKGRDATLLLLREYEQVIKQKVLFTKVRMLHEMPQLSLIFKEVNYEYEDHLNFLADLTIGVDELWKQLYKSKRQAINKAKRIGVSVEEIEDKKRIPIFYELVKESYRNSKTPLADISLFESVFDVLVPKNMCKFFLAKYKDNYVASTCFLCYRDYIFDWYGGVDRKFSACRANELLEWYSLKWSAENGYRVFDFGGAGKPDEPYGPRQFKKEFGGKLVNYGWWMKVHSPLKMKIAEKGFSIYQKMFFK